MDNTFVHHCSAWTQSSNTRAFRVEKLGYACIHTPRISKKVMAESNGSRDRLAEPFLTFFDLDRWFRPLGQSGTAWCQAGNVWLI